MKGIFGPVRTFRIDGISASYLNDVCGLVAIPLYQGILTLNYIKLSGDLFGTYEVEIQLHDADHLEDFRKIVSAIGRMSAK